MSVLQSYFFVAGISALVFLPLGMGAARLRDRTSHRRSDGPGAIPVRGEVNNHHNGGNA